ncbi:MAG: glycosyl hydrolase, partial [Bacteroidales bacterium]|nr:glycosyl hydrolase [Bacteroidales bacterium]
MKKISLISAGIVLLTGLQAQNQKRAMPPAKRKISVVITAQNTNFRLSKSTQLEFEPKPQPYEHTPCVFVDTTKTFQTFLGIGAALTDAAAETFAKLPPKKQEEFMRIYFDKE